MKKMNIYFDTEFTGLHKKTTLISIGFISDSGETLYIEFNDYDNNQVDDWIKENVISNLYLTEEEHGVNTDSCKGNDWLFKGNRYNSSMIIKSWLSKFDKVDIWSDCLSYDWVLFCDLYLHAFYIPDNVYYIPFDICTLFKLKGIDADISREDFAEMKDGAKKHNALWDAKVIKECYIKAINQ